MEIIMTVANAVAKPQDKAEIKQDKRPASANEVLESVNEAHDWKHEPEDLTSTGGIQKALKRNSAAIQALADYIDKK
jgi:phosphoserine aminotransferase